MLDDMRIFLKNGTRSALRHGRRFSENVTLAGEV